jgi:hypothetical protein
MQPIVANVDLIVMSTQPRDEIYGQQTCFHPLTNHIPCDYFSLFYHCIIDQLLAPTWQHN